MLRFFAINNIIINQILRNCDFRIILAKKIAGQERMKKIRKIAPKSTK